MPDEARVIPLHPRKTPSADAADQAPVGPTPTPAGWEQALAAGLAFLRRRVTGDYEVDEFGFDPDLTENVAVPALRPLYRTWFRTEVSGIDNVPSETGALLVANHAGGLWALDATMVSVAVHDEHPAKRFLRLLGADLRLHDARPGLARPQDRQRRWPATPTPNGCWATANSSGSSPRASRASASRSSERYKLQRFGRGGFVSAALRAGVPIIPVSVVGSEEIHPVLGNAKTLARMLNLPYFPLTPTFPWLGPLGLIPLPSKWFIEFGEPIDTSGYGPDAADDPMLVFELTDRVRETIQTTLYRLLRQRTSVWH